MLKIPNGFKFKPHKKIDRGHQAHEHYKLQWMMDHGYTLTDLFDKIGECMCDFSEDLDEAIQNFEDNIGFDGSLWPCYEEFMAFEYHDCGYDKEEK